MLIDNKIVETSEMNWRIAKGIGIARRLNKILRPKHCRGSLREGYRKWF